MAEMVKGFGSFTFGGDSYNQSVAEDIATEFKNYMDEFHKMGTISHTDVMIELYANYIFIWQNPFILPSEQRNLPNFRPSGLGGCPREHYLRLTGEPTDGDILGKTYVPHQTRWQDLGTATGLTLQNWILNAEKTFSKPKFKFERKYIEKAPNTAKFAKCPHMEEFSTISKVIVHKGWTYRLQGSTDGILIYENEDGERLRVGLEIKSKQTSYSRTSLSSMKAPDAKHVKQCTGYSLMFGIDYFIIAYQNLSKHSWGADEAQIRKCPDLRVFGLFITEDMKEQLKDDLANHVENAYELNPPKMDVDAWLFNNYKYAIATTLSEDELDEIKELVESEPHIVRDYKGRDKINSKRVRLDGVLEQILELRSMQVGSNNG